MSLKVQTRASDSGYVDTITGGITLADGELIRPAETNWHMVISRRHNKTDFILVGPWSTSGVVRYDAHAEILWIRLKMGVYMPHLPTRQLSDAETTLPDTAGNKVWLRGDTWQLPNYENADTFIHHLVHDGTLCHDAVILDALNGHADDMAARTLRYRFLHSTGLSQKRIQQIHRAQYATALLRKGATILDATYEAGYYDQPHLTRSLRQYIGYTPSQLQSSSE